MNTIYVGDTMPIEVSWFIPSAENPYQSTDATIISAEVTVIRNKDRALLVSNAVAEISGNETIYTLPSELTMLTGLHTAYVTATFNDDNVLTQEIEFYVRSK